MDSWHSETPDMAAQQSPVKELLSGHDTKFQSTDALDRRTFDEMDRLGQSLR